MTSAAIGSIRLRMPSAAAWLNASSAVGVDGPSEQSEQTAPTPASSTATMRLGGRHDRNVREDHAQTHRRSLLKRLSSESSSGQLVQADPAPRAVSHSGGEPHRHCATRPPACVPPVEGDAADRRHADERSGEPAVVGRTDQHLARTIVHRFPDRPATPRRREPAAHHHDHALGHPLDLAQHVRTDDHRAPFRRRGA